MPTTPHPRENPDNPPGSQSDTLAILIKPKAPGKHVIPVPRL